MPFCVDQTDQFSVFPTCPALAVSQAPNMFRLSLTFTPRQEVKSILEIKGQASRIM
jgi:hypothetical protein